MALPEADIDRIRLWCRGIWPEHLWNQAKVEADVSARHVDSVEVRPPWDGIGEHTRFPIARLRHPLDRTVVDLLAGSEPHVP